jgi:RNA polymerase sigma-H factor
VILLSQTHEEEEIIKLAQNGNQEAIEYLINQNMDIVFAKAKYFFIKGLDKDDVIQEGRVGLYKAIRDYKVNRRASFRGFSQLCVHRQLVSAIKKANRQKHIPLNTSTSLDKTIDYDDSKGRSFNEILPDISGTISRQEYKELIGNYTFKIKLTGNIWRRIKIAASATLADLHLAIQAAFNFADDYHLYAFYMSNKAWQGISYDHPDGTAGLNAEEKKIFELGLDKDQQILYIFDFGDDWRFSVIREDFIEEKEISKAEIIECRGESPDQYGWY